MARNIEQPGEPTPPPLNEEHMLEWVEGRLSRIEEGKRAGSVRAGVVDRVRQMQANRRALQSLAVEAAPPELMERVLAALERDALLGLTTGTDIHAHPPIPIAPHIERAREGRGGKRWAPGLAMAAGLLLLVGGAAYWGSMLIRPATPGVGPGPIAINTPSPEDAGGPSLNTLSAPVSPGESRTAMTDSSPPAAMMAKAGVSAMQAEDAAVAMITAPLSEERVLQLAREGRLVMRVFAPETRSLAQNLAQIDAMDTLKNGRTWKASRDVPLSVAAAVLPVDRPMGPPMRPEPEPALAQMASMMSASAAINWPIGPAINMPLAKPMERVRATYMVELLDTPKSLAAVKATFKDRLKAGVVFEELPEALGLPHTSDPESLLWWTLPPSAWTQRVAVPVVVETR